MPGADVVMEDAPGGSSTGARGSTVGSIAASTSPWVEKYRPQTLDDVIAQKDIIDTIGRLVDENRMPHLLLYGPPGTGKTSTILAVARRVFGDNYKSMTLELNASDDRKIQTVREEIKDFASTRSIFNAGFKLVILDEADAMRNEAQFALRRVIEKFTANTRFCIICNYVGKIIPALQSRCTKFRFGPLDPSHIEGRLSEIIRAENITVTPDGMEAVQRLSRGDMRRCLNILQSTSMAFPQVDEGSVYSCTGNPQPKDLERMMHWLLNEGFEDAYEQINAMSQREGYALIDLVREIHVFVVTIAFPAAVRIALLEGLADLEARLLGAANERVQLAAFVGLFQIARNDTVKATQSS